MKEIFTAASVEEARAKAAESFGVEEEKIAFTVIEEPKKGLFGKIKGEAKVEASYEPPTKTQAAQAYITELLTKMGIENISVVPTEIENGVNFEIGGDGFEELIGKKGELLDALQYLSSLVCNKIDREYFRITTDCNGFRDRRREQLEKLAAKIAAGVKKTGRTSALEPMNPYERRIIHAAVSEIEGVTSRSVGEEPALPKRSLTAADTRAARATAAEEAASARDQSRTTTSPPALRKITKSRSRRTTSTSVRDFTER